MNPYVQVRGGTASGTQPALYIDRVTQGEFTMSNKTFDVLPSSLAGIIPDGAKILDMKIHNINGRKLSVTIPPSSGLLLTTGNTLTAPTIKQQKVVFAPITVFPKLKVEIPDIAAASIDVGSVSPVLFTILTDGDTDRVVVRFHYKQAI